MNLPNFPISQAVYDLAWRNRKPDETVPHCIARAVSLAFGEKPLPKVDPRPLLSYVTVIDSEVTP